MPEELKTLTVDQKSALLLLHAISDGTFMAEVSDRVAELTKDMTKLAEATGGKHKGKVTISVEFLLDRGVYEVTADVMVREPKRVRGRSFLYGLPGGGLSPQNPNQLSLPLPAREVSTAHAADVRVIR